MGRAGRPPSRPSPSSVHSTPAMLRFRIAVAAAGVVAAAAAASPAQAACAGADVMPSSANAAKVGKATLCLLNVQRRTHGLRKLRENAKLRRASADYSQLMVSEGFFSHVSPSGSTFESRVRGTHYLDAARAWAIGENIAWGTGGLGTPRSIVRAWMHSPGHRANILNGTFRDIGIGIATGAPIPAGAAANGATYTTDFGYRG
jgi:uncharacterized protein YkwD